DNRVAANSGAAPVNHLSVSGNACGPAAFLNALRFGDPNWQRGMEMIVGNSDKTKLSYTLRVYGLRPSKQLAGRTRWSKAGINVEDLIAMGNDVLHGRLLPELKGEVLLPKSKESATELLERSHAALARSFRNGLPPIVSVRRQVLRKGKDGKAAWLTIESHFITLLRIPGKVDAATGSFAFDYLDPWGGKRCSGTFRIAPPDATAYGLIAELPSTPVGKKLVKEGERTSVTLSAVVGRW
ncbi:MAG: hypothetical protein CFE26_14410, partial [Verrucomicrobiales bacterium VVV1]